MLGVTWLGIPYDTHIFALYAAALEADAIFFYIDNRPAQMIKCNIMQ